MAHTLGNYKVSSVRHDIRGPRSVQLWTRTVVYRYYHWSTVHSTIVVLVLSCLTSLDLEINIYLMRRFNESSVSCGIRQRIKLPLSFVGNIVEISLKLTILGKLYTVDYSGLTAGQCQS